MNKDTYIDRSLALDLVKETGVNLSILPSQYQDDKDIVLLAMKDRQDDCFDFASNNLKNDKPFVLSLIKGKAIILQYVSETLKNDKEIVLESVLISPHTFQYASSDLKDNPEFIKKLIGSVGTILRFASDNIKDNKEVVLAAVTSKGYSLKYASERLKNDYAIVWTAISENGNAYQFASEQFQNNRDFVEKALIMEGRNYKNLPEVYRNDPYILLLAYNHLYKQAIEFHSVLDNPTPVEERKALNDVKNIVIDNIGQELKNEIGENDILSYLEKRIFKEQLDQKLPTKKESVKKIKI